MSAASACSVDAVFEDYAVAIQQEQEIKENLRLHLRDLEQLSREISSHLQKIHQPKGFKNMSEILIESESLYKEKGQPLIAAFAAQIPEDQFHKYYNMFNFTMTRLVYLAALIVYLKEDRLIERKETAEDWLNIGYDLKKGFHLELEDYLGGLILLSNEMSRFCVNCVTHGDYERPLAVSGFLNDLLTGFRLLNLKNDNLRKKFDSLKYDMKKVEEVVYDLSIRGLTKKKAEEAGETKTE